LSIRLVSNLKPEIKILKIQPNRIFTTKFNLNIKFEYELFGAFKSFSKITFYWPSTKTKKQLENDPFLLVDFFRNYSHFCNLSKSQFQLPADTQLFKCNFLVHFFAITKMFCCTNIRKTFLHNCVNYSS
jgi:hypothetical protein